MDMHNGELFLVSSENGAQSIVGVLIHYDQFNLRIVAARQCSEEPPYFPNPADGCENQRKLHVGILMSIDPSLLIICTVEINLIQLRVRSAPNKRSPAPGVDYAEANA